MNNLATVAGYRNAACDAEQVVRDSPGAMVGTDSESVMPVKHSYGNGCYVREWSCPAGMVVVSKIHKVAHPVFMLEGEVLVLTEDGVEKITAPHHGITRVGTKRVLRTLTKTRWVTVHVTEHTDICDIEDQIIAKDFNDPAISAADMAKLMEPTE